MIKTVDDSVLASLAEEARQKPRKRTNFNIHADLNDPIQRLCITGDPETVFPVHRHLEKWELITRVCGSFTIYTYHEDGTVSGQYEFAPGKLSIAEFPEGIWHNCIFHEPGTTFIEVKKGPYAPLTPEEQAPFEGVKHESDPVS